MDFLGYIAKDFKDLVFKWGGPKEKGAKDVKLHLRVFEDSVSLMYWYGLPADKGEFSTHAGEFFGAIDFSGAKVKDLKAPVNKQWYQALRKVHQDFYQFLLAQGPTITKWTGSVKGDEAEFEYEGMVRNLEDDEPAPPKAAPPKEENKEEKKVE